MLAPENRRIKHPLDSDLVFLKMSFGLKDQAHIKHGSFQPKMFAPFLILGLVNSSNISMETVMLVLSRRANDTIVLPELNVTIEILQLKGKNVRVGVDAPVEIRVLRGELEAAKQPQQKVVSSISLTGDDEHELRNKLNSLSVAISYSQKLLENGELNLAAANLNQTLEKLQVPNTAAAKSDSRCRALLVEDMDNEREMLAGFLRLHGYAVDTVANGLAAMDYLASNPQPDFIMMDIRMPKMNGTELIKQIRQNPAFDSVKLFAISGESQTQVELDLQANRVAKWFQKPLQPAELVSEINHEFGQLQPGLN